MKKLIHTKMDAIHHCRIEKEMGRINFQKKEKIGQ